MKLLSLISKKESIRQMSHQDKEKYLESLSNNQNLKYFKNIYLVHSYEDGYSPLYSSKVIIEKQNSIYNNMCTNFWANAKVEILFE